MFRYLAEQKVDNCTKNAENSDMLCKSGGFYGANQAVRCQNR